jgi:hypothetical protein
MLKTVELPKQNPGSALIHTRLSVGILEVPCISGRADKENGAPLAARHS